MAEGTTPKLDPHPRRYESSRGLFDVLVGKDAALPLIELASTGDATTLKNMLTQQVWTEIALESRHRIYSEDRPSSNENDVRGVTAMKILNLERIVLEAAENGHAGVVSTLLDFASQHHVDLSAIDRIVIEKTVANGHAAVLEALAAAKPSIADCNLGHGMRPLDLAVDEHQSEVAAVLLQLGASGGAAGSYNLSLLCRATRDPNPRMLEVLLQHNLAVTGSGALQSAAERGALDHMRLLVQSGADVNERLPANSIPRHNRSLLASWTPMHFAASAGHIEAMKLLESQGASTDVLDENGKTPAQLLQEQN